MKHVLYSQVAAVLNNHVCNCIPHPYLSGHTPHFTPFTLEPGFDVPVKEVVV